MKRIEIPELETIDDIEEYKSEMQEIISAPPSWLVQWGMTVLFLVLLSLLGITALISYPDVVKTQLKISSENAPKTISAKKAGRIVKLLKQDNSMVVSGDVLAYMESTGNPEKTLNLLNELKVLQQQLYKNEEVADQFVNAPSTFQLGELQSAYTDFYQAYLSYRAVVSSGSFIKRLDFLQKELVSISAQRENLTKQKKLQERTFELAKQEYDMHKTLFEQKVEAKMEFKREELKFLSSQQPLQQIQSSLLINTTSYSNQEKEIMELKYQINDIKSSFLQALNRMISSIENWKTEHVLVAPQSGKLTFSEFIQPNQYVNAGQELYNVDSGNSDFFGTLSISQNDIGKVERGQKVLIKLKSFPYEEYGVLYGRVSSITNVPVKDSVFLSKVDFDLKNSKFRKPIHLRAGMTADAEIITENATLLKRLMKNVIKIVE